MGRAGLLGTMARTAVVAGTASAVSGGVHRRAEARVAADRDQQATKADLAAAQAELAATRGAAPLPRTTTS
jgi:hypothetical protein